MKNILRKLIPRKLINYYHGAVAVVMAVSNGMPARKLKVIGVTGTDGKTTTSSYIFQILKQSGKKVVLISTIGAYFGDEMLDVGLHVTSPSPKLLQKLLKRAVNEGYEYAVIETTSHGLDQYRLMMTNINYAVVTNITHEHLDYHKTFDNYVKAKSRIANTAKLLVVNGKDEGCQQLLQLIDHSVEVVEFKISTDTNYSDDLREKFQQKYNQENGLAAAILCQNLGMTQNQIIAAIKNMPDVMGRMERVNQNKKEPEVIVDFAHTPNSLKQMLCDLNLRKKGKLIVVLGAAGLRDYQKRPQMGEIAASLADIVVFSAEDPRSEKVEVIINQLKSGVKKHHEKIITILKRDKAIENAIRKFASTSDIVAILGKGHEQSMNLDGEREIPWSDITEAKKALSGRS